MNKIPTLFVRDFGTRPPVLLVEVTPGCEWVIAGEGAPTRKYDGTCVALLGGLWWARREVKPGKVKPEGFVALSTDDETGKVIGWEPAVQSGWWKYLAEAIDAERGLLAEGTYELCGPKVNGNPERLPQHALIRHAAAQVLDDVPRDFAGLREWLSMWASLGYEGIVWHHPDGRMAKLKGRDYRS